MGSGHPVSLETCNNDVKTEVIILNNDTITDVITSFYLYVITEIFFCHITVITGNKFY